MNSFTRETCNCVVNNQNGTFLVLLLFKKKTGTLSLYNYSAVSY